MTRQALNMFVVALLTVAPFGLAQAASPELENSTSTRSTELSLPGVFIDCAGLEQAKASEGVPDCIIKAVTRSLQERVEWDARLYLQVRLQDQNRRLLAGKPSATDTPVAAASADRAGPAS